MGNQAINRRMRRAEARKRNSRNYRVMGNLPTWDVQGLSDQGYVIWNAVLNKLVFISKVPSVEVK
jgi:hypothetical protein